MMNDEHNPLICILGNRLLTESQKGDNGMGQGVRLV